jgi:hypothetical protein
VGLPTRLYADAVAHYLGLKEPLAFYSNPLDSPFISIPIPNLNDRTAKPEDAIDKYWLDMGIIDRD